MPKLLKLLTKSLSLRLSLIMVCAIALLLTAALFVMFHFSRQSLKQEAMNDAMETLDGKTKQIDNILLSVEQSAGNIYWDFIRHLDQPERIEQYCREIVECDPYAVGCAIAFDPSFYGSRVEPMTYVHRKGYQYASDDTTELVTQYTFVSRPYTQQVWYTEPMTTGRAIWVGPLKNHATEDEALITFCLPVYAKGEKPVGVVAIDVTIQHLSEIVLADRPSPDTYVVLLARNGSFIIHPDREKLSHQTVFTQTHHGTHASVREAANAMVNGGEGYESFFLNDEKNHVFFQPFSREDVAGRAMEDLRWSIGVVYPDDEIFQQFDQLLYSLIAIALVGLVLFFLLCRLITHRQLLPLIFLKQSAKRIAEGDYDEDIPDTTREDEVGQLQMHFQRMRQALKARKEEDVQLAAELQERGEHLQKAYDEAKKADRMKIAFLHFMTNQMLQPAEAIEKNVTDICQNCDGSPEKIGRLAENVWQQGETMLEALNMLIKEAETASFDEGETANEKGGGSL